MKCFLYILCFILFISCKNGQLEDSIYNVEILTFKETAGVLEDTTFFKSMFMVPLEINNSALIARINRIYMANDTLFILDTNYRSITIFNKEGKYINSIQNLGVGPKEYVDLGDICLDSKNKELLVLCTRPSKLQFYNYQGEFLREKGLGDKYYSYVAADGQYIYLQDDTNVNKSNKEVDIYDQHLNFISGTLDHGEVFKNKDFHTVNHFGHGNTMTQNSFIYIAREFDNIIYEAREGKVYPKYQLDFKEHRLPKELLNSKMKPFDFLDFCKKKQYVISLKEIVEVGGKILFVTNIGIFICDKQSGDMIQYTFMLDTMSGMGSSDIQVIGNTNKIAMIWSVNSLKRMTEMVAKYSNSKINLDFIKRINAMDEEDNPVLFIYEF